MKIARKAFTVVFSDGLKVILEYDEDRIVSNYTTSVIIGEMRVGEDIRSFLERDDDEERKVIEVTELSVT